MASVCARCNAKLGMLTTALSMGEQAVYCDKCGRIVEREEKAQYAKSQEAKKQRMIELKQLSKNETIKVSGTVSRCNWRIRFLTPLFSEPWM
jgi:hypothetical protein